MEPPPHTPGGISAKQHLTQIRPSPGREELVGLQKMLPSLQTGACAHVLQEVPGVIMGVRTVFKGLLGSQFRA